MGNNHIHPFEKVLEVSREDLSMSMRALHPLPWADFLLNPRRLRGSDFLMRWSQGVWSEEKLTQAVNTTGKYFALPYGPSGTAPDNDVRAFELYFERLEKAGLGKIKRPDLLIFSEKDRTVVESIVTALGGLAELPFTEENNVKMSELLSLSIIAIECENSLWRAKQMPDYSTSLKPQKRLGGKDGLKKNAVLPTIIIKDEDRIPLNKWQQESGVPIHIWHSFFDISYGISLDDAENLFSTGLIQPTVQVFQAPGGATTRKAIYKIYYHYAYPLAITVEDPELVADCITDKNGHILPFVRFCGGSSNISAEALSTLDSLAK